ncbi:capsid protein [Candidatus Clostridium stratigraminis]|uniref:Capsid protein n=1 Tax=Candidatus Clostridium stratigraminis TaxID=3381661 RepID=A0ABW8SYF9_9CLOT
MGLIGGIKNVLTKAAIKLLNIQPAQESSITIREPLSFQGNVLRNRIWYRGDPSELDQFFKQSAYDLVSKSRFWAAVPSHDLNIRKIHSGLPAMVADRLSDIVVADIDNIELNGEEQDNQWEEISQDNKLNETINTAITEALVAGDGAFKITIDTDITRYPIIEFYSGEKVEYNYKRGRLFEVIFYTSYCKSNKDYTLIETFGKGYINNELQDSYGKPVPLATLEETAGLQDVTFDGSFIMAIPLMFFQSPKFDGRGKSIFDNKTDSFDALDEVISQWIDAIRDGRVKQYIPEDLLPKNPTTGEIIKPNPFDNKYIATGSSLAEDAKNEISLQQAAINYQAYVDSYSNAIDMCLQGIISPSTLGIDLKKKDNAEAQREKEKTTLYTRGKIVDTLTEVIPELVQTVLMVQDILNEKAPGEYEATISFGEYASPSFDAVVDTVGKAKSYGIMSVEKAVEEMYGDTLSDEEKAEEVQRIKEQNGMLQAEDPKVVDNADLTGGGNGQEG